MTERGESDAVRITRDVLRDGSLLARIRANALKSMDIRSDAEIEGSLDSILAGHDTREDVWLFAHGSLIWNPAFAFAARVPALLRGWHRRYAFWMRPGRGSLEHPGLTLGLDRGGQCAGIAYRIAASVRDELLLVWRREMFGRAYIPRWVTIESGAVKARAIAFTVNARHTEHVGGLNDDDIARVVASTHGALGSCAEYLHQTLAHLHEFGLSDPGLERIAGLVEARRRRAARREAGARDGRDEAH